MAVVNEDRLKNVTFVAEVDHVKELRLLGTANLDFWKAHLAHKPFQPASPDGFAAITIAATELSWMGVRFHELTLYLSVADKNNPAIQSGYFLLQAFNSVRFFAFSEKAFFSTPYHYAKVKLSLAPPVSMEAWVKNHCVINAEMNSHQKNATTIEDNWTGPVLLPGSDKYFVVKLSGNASLNQFNPELDILNIHPHPEHPVFEWLLQSEFKPQEWRIRSDAFHAKSKTYPISV